MHPMIYVGIGLGTLLIAVILASYFYAKTHTVSCPICKHIWRPPFHKILFTMHTIVGNVLTCPNCNEVVVVKYHKKTKNKK